MISDNKCDDISTYLDLESALPVMRDVVIFMNLFKEEEFLLKPPESSPGCTVSFAIKSEIQGRVRN